MFWKCVQMIGVAMVSAGVALELYTRQDWHFITITAGSFIFALGTKFVYYKKKHRSENVPRETHNIEGDIHVG